MLVAYTDASVIGETSIHSYVLLKEEKLLLRNSKIENIKETTQAEMFSIIYLLTECYKRGISNILVYTDNISIANGTKKNPEKGAILKEWLQKTNSEVKWLSRKFNKQAHNICESVKKIVLETNKDNEKTKIDTSKLVMMKEERHINSYHKKGWISKENLKDSHLDQMSSYYVQLVKPECLKSMDEILEWGKEKESSNTHKGRLRFIERFVSRNHNIDEIRLEYSTHALMKIEVTA